MLITQLKDKETITSLVAGKKVFIINCHGCKEVHFPEKEAVELQKELSAEGNVTGIMTTDYICNPENMELRLKKHMEKIQASDLVLVFSCGVGVQTIAEYLDDKKKFSPDFYIFRFKKLDQVLHDYVDYIFVKISMISKREQI